MKGDQLGEFEELTLLAVCALKGTAYGVPVLQFIEQTTGRNVTIGAVYAALARLDDKGYVRSVIAEARQIRGGKRKRLFEPTPEGRKAIADLRRVRDRIWHTIESKGPLG